MCSTIQRTTLHIFHTKVIRSSHNSEFAHRINILQSSYNEKNTKELFSPLSYVLTFFLVPKFIVIVLFKLKYCLSLPQQLEMNQLTPG